MAGTTSPRKSTPNAASPKSGRTVGEKGAGTEETGSRWTFLTNHSHVLVVLHDNPDLVLREVAIRVGITERAVQRIIQDLEQDGFIQRERVGRRNHYNVIVDEPLRHPLESHRNIGDLLALITSEDGQ